ncbi:MAG TPA: hypothetical protein VFE11_01705 [Dongiaceae bacterium]|nr:hypothetical protein [Dongiaceae bacterium]
MSRLNFAAVNRVALAQLPALLRRWLPDGRIEGHEFTARNPTRRDRQPGSFRINMATGRWADFATGDKGGDVVSLAAYLAGIGQSDAARKLAAMLGMESRR